jgi:hypothetical protein
MNLRRGPGDIIQPRPVFRSPFNCDDYDACREHYCPDRDRRDLERGRLSKRASRAGAAAIASEAQIATVRKLRT